MLIYDVKNLPDITLSKYQALEDSGIESMLESQTRLLRQLYRFAAFGKIAIHYLFNYDPDRPNGTKLKISIAFSSTNGDARFDQSLDKIIRASNVAEQFKLQRSTAHEFGGTIFQVKSSMRKKERMLQTVVNGAPRNYYIVPNWEVNEDARLFSLLKLMESFDEKCCYRVDLYAVEGLNEKIHKNFERPLSFLRGSNSAHTGIETATQRINGSKDPNVDETLKQYEKWLTNVDESNVFRCRICAYTDDEQYARLLLDTAFAESIEVGNNTIQLQCGSFDPAEDFDIIPQKECLIDAPPTMEEWSTTYTVEEIAAFTRLPILYDGENTEIPKETVSILVEGGINLGKDKNGYDVLIPEKLFSKHMFVCGVPGAGKTNTMLHIANSLWNGERKNEDGTTSKLRIPFLVLEPAKREYRELALFDIPELLIFSPSACTNFPIKINPFEFPKGLTLSEHIGKLCQVFEGAFPIAPPAPFILDRAIQAIYEKHGWNASDVNVGVKEYPTMSELYAQFEAELNHTNYDSEIRGNIRSVLEMRIGSLLRREMKDIFDVKKSTLTPEEWMQHPIIVELEALGEGPANFVTLLLCTLIREALKANPLPDDNSPIRHVIFIEEAHNLIAPQSQVQDGQDSNPKIAATAYIVKMLAEVRALREGIIIADQLPTAMAPEVIKNTNIKLVHRLTSQDDRELVGSTMSASTLQLENMAIYTSGQALFTFEKMLRPMEMQVHCVEGHGEVTPDDNRLFALMMDGTKKPGYYALRKRDAEQAWDQLKAKVKNVLDKEQQAVNQLLILKQRGLSLAEFEKRADSCLTILDGIKLMKRRLKWECDCVDSVFIAENRKAELGEIIINLGNQYERTIQRVITEF